MKNQWVLLTLALIITLAAAVYQRLTGPTHPKRATITFNDTDYKVKLLRSSENLEDCKIILDKTIPQEAIPVILWRHYPTEEDWTISQLTLEEEGWTGVLPKQPAAGKLEYFIRYHNGQGVSQIPEDLTVVIRFTDPVPDYVLIPHILFMFLAMYFSNLMGLGALLQSGNYVKHAWIAAGLLLVGGFILGPLVQKFAFGEYWTGIPFGWDLTDNKTLLAGIGFAVGLWKNRKTGNPYWILMASIIMLLVYLIPHSVLGSELDHSTGQIGIG